MLRHRLLLSPRIRTRKTHGRGRAVLPRRLLVASGVLRCNDCIDYHVGRCVEAGWSDEEIYDALNVALVVGGTIFIPHLRHAVDTLDLLREERGERQGDSG